MALMIIFAGLFINFHDSCEANIWIEVTVGKIIVDNIRDF